MAVDGPHAPDRQDDASFAGGPTFFLQLDFRTAFAV